MFTWDDVKRDRNLAKDGLDFIDAQDRFDWNAAIILKAHEGAKGGLRFKAIGHLDQNLVALIYAPLGTEALSLISLRPASRSERRLYAQA